MQLLKFFRARITTLLALALALVVSAAFAQAATPPTLNYGDFISAIQTYMVNTFNSAGPQLFVLLGVIGAFYFVWGRIRSLWG